MQRIAIERQDRGVGVYAASASLGLLGVALVLLCTWRYGIGLSPDSANYVSAARSLLAGEGYRYVDGGIYTHWPPLFPTLLAIPGLVGIGPMVAARWVNALAFGGIIFFAGLLFSRCTTSRAAAVLGTLSVLLSVPLLVVSNMAWSEPVFILLAVLFVWLLPGFLRTRTWSSLLAISLVVALACLERYAGVTLIATGGIAIVLGVRKASVLDRLKYSIAFCLLSGVPLALWLVRNRVLAGQTTGSHHLNWSSIGEMGRPLVAAGDVMATWFFERPFAGTIDTVAVGLILFLAAAAALISHLTLGEPEGRRPAAVWSAGLFVLVYTGFIAFSGAGLAWDPQQRHMAPVYVFAMLLIFAGVDDAFRLLGRCLGGRAFVQSLGAVLMAWWLLHPLDWTSETVKSARRDGAGGYSTRAWEESALIRWLRTDRLDGSVYSNVPDALYLLTGTAAKDTPHYYWDTTEFAGNMPAGQASYIVWHHGLRWNHLYDLRELASRWRLEPVAELSDGAVYRFLGVGGPELCAVYRFWSPQKNRHLYTLDKPDRDGLILHHAGQWKDEGAVFYVYTEGRQPAGARPVYRLWCESLQTCFYAIGAAERDAVLAKSPGLWQDHGVAWYAFAEEGRPADTRPVYRFWSDTVQTHFYTIEEAERDKLIADFSHVWTYEGVVWYAYGK